MISSLLALLLAAAGTQAPAEAAGIELALVDITIRQRLILRIPMPRPAPPPTRWRERKGPRCIDLGTIAGAAIAAPDSVDIILRGGSRLRAKLESACPALDFYSGFYLLPTGDGRICADRDAIHTRSGGECGIDRLRRLVPDVRR